MKITKINIKNDEPTIIGEEECNIIQILNCGKKFSIIANFNGAINIIADEGFGVSVTEKENRGVVVETREANDKKIFSKEA